MTNSRALNSIENWAVSPGKINSDHRLITYSPWNDKLNPYQEQYRFNFGGVNWTKFNEELKMALREVERQIQEPKYRFED
jgi:hypothetical protein